MRRPRGRSASFTGLNRCSVCFDSANRARQTRCAGDSSVKGPDIPFWETRQHSGPSGAKCGIVPCTVIHYTADRPAIAATEADTFVGHLWEVSHPKAIRYRGRQRERRAVFCGVYLWVADRTGRDVKNDH